MKSNNKNVNNFVVTPKNLGFFFPAEWEPHYAVWVSWIHNQNSFNNIDQVIVQYSKFIKELSKSEIVRINVNDEGMKNFAIKKLVDQNVDLSKIEFFFHKTNDAWCRDYGPAFLINSNKSKKIIVNWGYNAWGNKYLPYDFDNMIPELIAEKLHIPIISPQIIIEGGSVEFNGRGTVITSRSCLLHYNRNPHLTQIQIEKFLCEYYGQEQVLWISNGIIGNDTDGHIDEMVRFINYNTVLVSIEENKYDANYIILQKNLKELKKIRLLNGDYLNIIELPLPKKIIINGVRIPASYTNFYIANHSIIVPIFQNQNDDKALNIIQSCFKDRKVIGMNSKDIILGLGSFHCLTQQEPQIISDKQFK